MTDVTELLARLTAAGPGLERGSTATGSRLTAADIALALAHVDSPFDDLLLFLYAGHHDRIAPLGAAALDALVRRYDWAEQDRSRTRLLVDQRLLEMLSPRLCPQCHGRGQHMRDALLVVCRRCAGAGLVEHTETSRIDATGIPRRAWYERWRGNYHQVSDLLGGWEVVAREQLRRFLR